MILVCEALAILHLVLSHPVSQNFIQADMLHSLGLNRCDQIQNPTRYALPYSGLSYKNAEIGIEMAMVPLSPADFAKIGIWRD
ncbi:hypothetical protein CEXT_671441 [Caerostris extrusa]|uniref:Uncharacterized protein n=1 Tax=Caerostris extrusa TaxID=172846 RepID=A0AAV4NER1_CAEEX|nr:hypothetical protein CEXT_671441 [Caerostris extrusa]